MTRAEIKQKIDQGAQLLNEAARILGCKKERDMIHEAAARLFLASCGEKKRDTDEDYYLQGM